MFMMPNLIKMWENSVNFMGQQGQSSAKADTDYYDAMQLTRGERQLAMAILAEQNVPEGSIFIIYPDNDVDRLGDKFDIIAAPRTKDPLGTSGQAQAQVVWEKFVEFLKSRSTLASRIDTVVIPGCGSSPLGSAAMGKTVANLVGKPVVSLVNGEGAFDKWCEVASGGMLMNPTANLLNMLDPALEKIADAYPLAAKLYLHDVLDAVPEAATLRELLRLRTKGDDVLPNWRGIVSHSKGNWAVLAALVTFELELPQGAVASHPPIDVVTFGNPVDLPNQKNEMCDRAKGYFAYHQYYGDNDLLAHLNSMQALSRLWFPLAQQEEKPYFLMLQRHLEKPLDLRGDATFDVTEHEDGNTSTFVLTDTGHHLFPRIDPKSPLTEKIVQVIGEQAGNMIALESETAAGQGETVRALANQIDIREEYREAFYALVRDRHDSMFWSDCSTPREFAVTLQTLMAKDAVLRIFTSETKPYHMPIEKILPAIFKNRLLH